MHNAPTVAIIDYGLGNLFSVKHACEHVGLQAVITAVPDDIRAAKAVILPGVGAFGDAMAALRERALVDTLHAVEAGGTPLIGICLGMQLLMSESYEFGHHAGLNFIEGSVVRFEAPRLGDRILKVPQIGWNRICKVPGGTADPWADSILHGIADGEYMYFVHSFYVKPADPAVVLSTTRYGHIDFCSSVQQRNITAWQFHPERSGEGGLHLYRQLALSLRP